MNTESIIRRARREAACTDRLDRLTAAVRTLATGAVAPDEARAILDRYCRAMRFRPASNDMLRRLCRPSAARMSVEAIDELLMFTSDDDGDPSPAIVAPAPCAA